MVLPPRRFLLDFGGRFRTFGGGRSGFRGALAGSVRPLLASIAATFLAAAFGFPMGNDPPARRVIDDGALQERRRLRARIGLLYRYAFGILGKAINAPLRVDVFVIVFSHGCVSN